jgi:hypothetical protein
VKYILESVGKRPPPINVETRWSSTHDMLSSLLKLKNTILDLKDKTILNFKITERSWIILGDIVNVLLPAKVATKKFQIESLTAGMNLTL